MDLNSTKPNLGSLFIGLLIIGFSSCSDPKEKDVKIRQTKIDTCNLNLEKGHLLEVDVSCRSCHVESENRTSLDLPTMYDLSRMDSLKLNNFIFISKHKDYFKKDTLLDFRLKSITRFSECERKNLVHYIKNYKRYTRSDF
ncbi:hypothetical protein ACTJKC_00495 [Pedobacter sp. 22226]|uniref:hypothetical protein n=1 Tax=Pedobacter sp. 22226 TaxID=3453894 RepID=UPI003F82DD8E